MLILAGVTINAVVGENGVLNRAQEAVIKNEKAQLKEELELAILDIIAEKLSNGQSMQREDLKDLANIGAVVESTGIPAIGEYKDYFFTVDENYEVEITEKVHGEKPTIQAQVITEGYVAQGGIVEIKVTGSISEGNIKEIVATNGAILKTDTSATEKIFTVNANGTYYFMITAENGRSNVASVEVNTIIEKPVIEIKEKTGEGFTIAVTNNYAEGLITEYRYYVEGVLKHSGTTDTKYVVTGLEEETEYTNIYVEAYIGEEKLTSEAITATTLSIWNNIAKMAKLISDNDDTITRDTLEVTMQIDGEDYTLAVGDTLPVKVDGKAKLVRIIGFNHDKLTDSSAYGEGEENTYAGISFVFIESEMSDSMNNLVATNVGGWGASKLKETLNNTTINTLSNKNNIKEVQKNYIQTYNDPNSVAISNDKLWLLSCSEIWNNGDTTGAYGYAITKEGEQYKYYKDINGTYNVANEKLVNENHKTMQWLLRSPGYQNDQNFCYVSNGICYPYSSKYGYRIYSGFSI